MKVRLATAVLLLFASTAGAGGIEGNCTIRFLGTSTLHDFTGEGRCEPFTAALARDGEGKTLLPSVVVEVPVADMKTGNDSRDRSMREMFRSDRHPVIRGTARDIDAGRIREAMQNRGEGKEALGLLLSIRGVERMIQATASNLKEEGSRLSFDLEFPVSLKEFDLKPPSVLGIIRVADKVLVKGSFSLEVPKDP